MTSDPFEALRRPLSPARPDPRFAVDLRRRLQEELGMTVTDEPAAAVTAGELGIVHMAVADADRAISFFERLFGWEAERTTWDGHVSHYVVNTKTLLVLRDNPTVPPVRLWYRVPDVASAVARVQELGGIVGESETTPDGGGWAEVADDQGTPFGLTRPRGDYGDHQQPIAEPTGDLGYLTISVTDTTAGREFYGSLLGWQFNDHHHVDNAGLPLGLRPGLDQRRPIDLYFRVADYEAAAARVRELGGTTEDFYDSPSGRGCQCLDDQGTVFFLWEPAPGY